MAMWSSGCGNAYGTEFPSLSFDTAGDINITVEYRTGRSPENCGVFNHELNSSNEVIGGTIVVYEMQSNGVSCTGFLDNVVAHELGHVFGLANTPCSGYLMGASYSTMGGPTSEECGWVNYRWTTPAEQAPPDPYCDAYCWTSCDSSGCPSQPPCSCSPILIDLDDDGFHLTSLETPVEFDIDADGRLDRISWTSCDGSDAFLVMDRNGNGRIDDGSELFGNSTRLTTGAPAPNGYVALAEFDTPMLGGNGDGVVDRSDPVWSRLRLWVDANHDGASQAEELQTLAEAGVSEISTKYIRSNRSDHYGNLFRFKAKAVVRDKHGREHRANTYDVFFRMDQD